MEYSVVIPQLQLAELSEKGFSSELMEYLAANGVSKDEVVAHMEQYPDATIDAAIGTIVMARQPVSGGVTEGAEVSGELPSEEVAAE